MNLTICVQYENGAEDCQEKRVEVRFVGEDPGEARLTVDSVRCTDVYAVPAGNGVEIRFAAEADLRLETESTLETVSAIRLDDDLPKTQERPSLTVVQTGGPLWDVARKYGSTVDLIRKVNGLEEESAPAGGVLFIPRERF